MIHKHTSAETLITLRGKHTLRVSQLYYISSINDYCVYIDYTISIKLIKIVCYLVEQMIELFTRINIKVYGLRKF